jgi:UDPglucose--hexose-1-phosphate uridylyltransferase
MELRKDPVTRSWVVVGHTEEAPLPVEPCPLCPGAEKGQTLLALPVGGGPWRVRVTPNPAPLYRIEGEVGRAAEGIYDKMRSVGAHEILIETPLHDRRLSQLSDEEIEMVFDAYRRRIADLKRDSRFKYATAIKNQGHAAAAEWTHAHSEVIATTFVPRRVLYELRAAKTYFQEKERCVFCDIVMQEERAGKRLVDTQGDYVAFCPYASRVPFETWILSRKHNHEFEAPPAEARRRHLAVLVGRTLRRLEQISDSYHMVLHTAPNTGVNRGEIADYWKTIAEDYHWHIEIMPILPKGSRSYALKEVYFNAVLPEDSAKQLRDLESSL